MRVHAHKRLQWKRDPDNNRAYIARPEGVATVPMARVRHDICVPRDTSWSWDVFWPNRFSAAGATDNKGAAEESATAAYHHHIVATFGWTLPAEPLIPPVVTTLSALTDNALAALATRYYRAVAYDNSGIESSRVRDFQVHYAIHEELRRRWRQSHTKDWAQLVPTYRQT